MQNVRLEAARRYIGRGWPVLPVDPKGKAPYGSLAPHGVHDATLSEGKVAGWLKKVPDLNIGVAAGGRLIILDLDKKDGRDGIAGLKKLANGRKLPETLAVRTPSGGYHYYFQAPEGDTIRSSKDALAPGIEVKSAGTYVVAPPSVNGAGPYKIKRFVKELATLPDWLAQAIQDAGSRINGKPEPVEDEIPKGDRNETLFKLGCSLRAKGLSRDEILAALEVANRERCKPPIGEHPDDSDPEEFNKIVASVCRYERGELPASTGTPSEPVAKPPAKERTLTLKAASDVTPRPVRWLDKGLIALGALNVFAGRQGLGKSTDLASIAAEVTRGTLRGDLRGVPSDVVFASFEDAEDSVLVPRLIAAGADLSRVHFVDVVTEGHADILTLPEDVNRIKAAVETVSAPLFVLDPLVASIDGGTNTHADAPVRRVLSPLAQLAEDAGTAVVAVMHLRKSSAHEAMDRVSGSIAFTAAARVVNVFGVDTDKGDDPKENPYRILAQAKNNYAPLAPSQSYKLEGHTIEHGGEKIETSRVVFQGEVDISANDLLATVERDEPGVTDYAEDWLADYLEDGVWHARKDIAESAENNRPRIAIRTLQRAMNNLGVEVERKGFPSRTQWRLTSDANTPAGDSPGTTDSVPETTELTPSNSDSRALLPNKAQLEADLPF